MISTINYILRLPIAITTILVILIVPEKTGNKIVEYMKTWFDKNLPI